MVDLHLHTTASDGRQAPGTLVRQAAAAGITVLSITDHDTTAGVAEAAAEAAALGLEFVRGIEITAVLGGRDVHVLGYFLDPGSEELQAFLQAQRQDRVRRARAMADRLAALGLPIDAEALVRRAHQIAGHAIGRPALARALVRAGHVASVQQAFDRFIGSGGPAYVPRRGAAPAEVVAIIQRAGGLASLAHPGLLRRDGLIPDLVGAGLDALEVYHPDHTDEDRDRYVVLARAHGLGMTGGSDYHGEDTGRASAFGVVGLPPEAFAQIRGLAARAGSSGRWAVPKDNME